MIQNDCLELRESSKTDIMCTKSTSSRHVKTHIVSKGWRFVHNACTGGEMREGWLREKQPAAICGAACASFGLFSFFFITFVFCLKKQQAPFVLFGEKWRTCSNALILESWTVWTLIFDRQQHLTISCFRKLPKFWGQSHRKTTIFRNAHQQQHFLSIFCFRVGDVGNLIGQPKKQSIEASKFFFLWRFDPNWEI